MVLQSCCGVIWGIINRFDRVIHTMGKLNKLSRIEQSDCQIIEEMMTKYSFAEHSQPFDATPVMLTLDEMESDVRRYRQWIEEYSKRK